MPRASQISSSQLTVLLLSSRLSNCLLLLPDDLSQINLFERLTSVLCSGIFLFLLFLPTLLALRKSCGGLIDLAYRYNRQTGRHVCVAYALLCLFILGMDVLQFYDFAAKSMKTEFSVSTLTVAMLVVALAAAFYGIQALGRTALPVALFSVASLIVFGVALVPEMRWIHFSPVQEGFGPVLCQAVRELPRTAEIVSVGMLYPHVSGSKWGAAASFSGLTALLTAFVSVTAMGVLGDYALQVAYPYYVATTAVQFGVLQRMDIWIVAVWLSTYFVRLTLFCTLFLNTCRRLWGRRARVPAALTALIVLIALHWLFDVGMPDQGRYWVTVAYWCALGVFCLVLPPLLWAMIKLKRRHKA